MKSGKVVGQLNMKEARAFLAAEQKDAALSANARHVLESRYLLKNEQGEIVESPDDLFRRVVRAVAQAELGYGSAEDAAYWEEAFYYLMRGLFFLPNSPDMINAGLPRGWVGS